MKVFGGKLDTADFCLIFEWIEDREVEVRIWETRERKSYHSRPEKTRAAWGADADMGRRGWLLRDARTS